MSSRKRRDVSRSVPLVRPLTPKERQRLQRSADPITDLMADGLVDGDALKEITKKARRLGLL